MATENQGANLRQFLIDSGMVTAKQLEEFGQIDNDDQLGRLLVNRKVLTEEEWAMISELQLETPVIDLTNYQIQPDALLLIPEAIARKYNVVPLAVNNEVLHVAMAAADDFLLLEALAARARKRIEAKIAPVEEIRQAIDRSYKAYGEIAAQFGQADTAKPESEGATAATETVAKAPVVRALDLLVNEAVKNRASDIHVEPEKDRLRVRYRIDGVLHDTMALPLSAHPPLMTRLKILAGMNIADHRPQDGQFSMRVMDRDIDVRVAIIPTVYGETGVLRILDKSFAALALSQLGFIPRSLKLYQDLLKSPFGMILISGPTGSGKTTTLYASVNTLDCIGRKIITIEDPVEYRFRGINQIQVNPRAGLTFASGLRSILRLDPDVLLVGEIRDQETAEIAIHASLTGHLVLSSIHASNSVGAIFRLIDLGVGPFLVSSAVIGVIAQRMLRRVCPHCRELRKAPVEAQLAYEKEMEERRIEFFYGRGCQACANTGYLGRTATFETLVLSEDIRRLLLTGANATQVFRQAEKEGIITMWHEGMIKAQEGITTPDEVIRCVYSIG